MSSRLIGGSTTVPVEPSLDDSGALVSPELELVLVLDDVDVDVDATPPLVGSTPVALVLTAAVLAAPVDPVPVSSVVPDDPPQARRSETNQVVRVMSRAYHGPGGPYKPSTSLTSRPHREQAAQRREDRVARVPFEP